MVHHLLPGHGKHHISVAPSYTVRSSIVSDSLAYCGELLFQWIDLYNLCMDDLVAVEGSGYLMEIIFLRRLLIPASNVVYISSFQLLSYGL